MKITSTSNRRTRRTVSHAGGVLLMAVGLLVMASSPAVAATACGTYSFGFEGTRLMNDGISTSAGPFTISLPAGTYDVTLVSNDNHPSADYQPAQTQEQWYVALDNGYTSPPANDIPADQTRTVTTFAEVEIAAATAISVHHLQSGGINSVNVECVGFTPSPVPETTTTEAPEVAGPTIDTPETPEVEAPAVVAPVVEEPAIAVPTTEAPAAATTTSVPARAVATPETPTTEAPVQAAAPVVEAEVLAEVETPLPTVLARTGPENIELTLVGLALMLAGVALVAAERRMTTDLTHTLTP